MSANLNIEDKNDEFKFHFMLHADKKSAGEWKDLPIPFPVENDDKVKDDGISQLPSQLKNTIVYRED